MNLFTCSVISCKTTITPTVLSFSFLNGAKYAFTNEADLLALDEIQAVYIASPVFAHKEQAFAAAKAKKEFAEANELVQKSVDGTKKATKADKYKTYLLLFFLIFNIFYTI